MSETPMIGMNVAEVEDLGRFLQSHAGKLESIRSQIDQLVRSAAWVGFDATRFTQQWWPEHAARLATVDRELEGLGQSALNNAAEQRQASESTNRPSWVGGAAAATSALAGTVAGPLGTASSAAVPSSHATAPSALSGSPDELKRGFLADWSRSTASSQHDQWNFRYNESGNCTSYVAWRINQLAAERGLGDRYLTNNNIGSVTGLRLGDAQYWGEHAGAAGFPPSTSAQPGAVAWWDAASGRGEHGHVAVVRSVSPDGTIVVEESAWGSAQFDIKEFKTADANYPTGFLNLLP